MKFYRFFLGVVFACSCIFGATLTHGPMIGHTTDSTSRIWVRVDKECDYQVRLTCNGGKSIYSKKIHLKKKDNFCGATKINGLSPSTIYSYQVLLDGNVQKTGLIQEFRTFPKEGSSGIIRIAFGHSIRGNDSPQTTWEAIREKKPNLLILMGDNIYSNNTDTLVQRPMYLKYRADSCFRSLAATTPVYAIWDDHDFGKNNSDRTQPGKERSLKTFFELWSNPLSLAKSGGIWSRFTVGEAEFFLLDVRYHRSPDADPDGPHKTMLGKEQLEWFKNALSESDAKFKFPVSGTSWNCGGVESWNHRYIFEYDAILSHIVKKKIAGIILLGGDQHSLKISVRPRESWGGYDLHEWMAGQIWNREVNKENRGFGMITIDTDSSLANVRLDFFDQWGNPKKGRRVLYTTPGALRAMWDSPPGVSGEKPPRSVDGELRPNTSWQIWDSLPQTTGEVLTEDDLRF